MLKTPAELGEELQRACTAKGIYIKYAPCGKDSVLIEVQKEDVDKITSMIRESME